MSGFIPTVCKTATFNGELTFWALFRTLKKRIYKIFSIFSSGQHRKLIRYPNIFILNIFNVLTYKLR